MKVLTTARPPCLMQSWKGLYSIVATLIRVFPKISSLGIVTFLFMLVFVLAGMQVRSPLISLDGPLIVP
jgi:hypothetical protein